MNINERITRARIQIQQRNSFFAYLSLYLKFKENKDLPEYAGAGVDINGNFYYKKEFIEKLSDDELQGVIIHEILHLSLLHLSRRKEREPLKFNICCDIVVNQLINDNGFKLPEGSIIPKNNEIEIWKQKIIDTNKKIAEEIYDELKDNKKGKGNGKGNNQEGRFDEHFEKGENGERLTENERKAIEKEWNNRTEEALTISKMKGDLPQGIERIVGRLRESKINWKALLNQFIIKQIPYDYTYSKPSKKSISVGTFMPDVLKQKVEVDVMIDLSGSIGQEEYDEFMSEVIAIARAFQEQISMKVYSHDTECYDNGLVENGNIEKLKKMELKGGGGTSFQNPLNYLKENYLTPKCLIWLTDGYGDKIENPNFPILWVLTKGGTDRLVKDKGVVIELKD